MLRPPKGGKSRGTWGWYHWLVGWSVLLLGVVNMFQGLALLGPGRWYIMGYSLSVVAFVGVRPLLIIMS